MWHHLYVDNGVDSVVLNLKLEQHAQRFAHQRGVLDFAVLSRFDHATGGTTAPQITSGSDFGFGERHRSAPNCRRLFAVA